MAKRTPHQRRLDEVRRVSTDATGAAIQPGPRKDGLKQACKNGHFFTVAADCARVLFGYVEGDTSEAVAKRARESLGVPFAT